MKTDPSLPACWLLIVMLSAISACTTPINKTTDLIPQPDELYATLQFDDDKNINVKYSAAEPEEVLQKELSALNQTGNWDDGTQEQSIAAPHKTYDFPVTVNKQVQFYLDLFQTQQRRYFKRWLARSTKYLPMIQQELDAAGLPRDLAYLAMIESGFNPSAYSRSRAAGLWQFIRSTGRNYNLRIDSWVDERRDPEKATKSAVAYLTDLYEEFGSWYLAVAAYNAGEGKIERAVRKYKTRDFWKLAKHRYFKLETKRYVPKLIAAIMIANEPEKYGFKDIDYQPPRQYDAITVPPRTDLRAVALTCNSDIKTIRKLNNELLRGFTPPGRASYELKIPNGAHDLVASNLSRLYPVVTTGYKTHIVRRGDSITRICNIYNLNKTILLKANNLHSAKLRAGQHLRIPYQTTKYVLLKKGETPESRFARAKTGGKLFLHQIKKGETLSRIARLYNVSVDIIMQWNDLQSAHKIRAGRQLALYLDQHGGTTPPPPAAVAQNTPTAPILRESKKRKSENPDRETRVTYYRVQRGDSLWAIAKKFQVSTLDIRLWNDLRSNTIHPGTQLVVRKG